MKKLLLSVICAVAALGFCSCEHKELCYHHPHKATIRVEFDWRNAPDANPAGMCVYFYPSEGASRRFDFSGTTGGNVELQVGKYRVECYNNDTEATLFRGTERFDTHEAFTREGNIFESIYGNGYSAPQSKEGEDQRVVICPDMLWGCNAYDVEITESGLSYICVPEKDKDQVKVESREQVITLYPEELICTYTYEVRNVENLDYVQQFCGSLSGMAPSLTFADGELGKECVTIPFAASSDGVSTITGGFYTFGHHAFNTQPHHLLLYIWFKEGSKYYYTFDVTDQVHRAPDRRHVHIVIDGLTLPTPIENGDGTFTPSVDEWEEIYQDIVL